MNLSRRSFLGGAGLVAAGTALPMSLLFGRKAHAAGSAPASAYGALVPDPAGILDLPAGFSYSVLESEGALMSDGYKVPGVPDGMACFPGPRGTLVLMRNQELSPNAANGAYPVGSAPAEAYDATAMGGVTRVVVDARTFARVSSNLVLAGTIRNCAGGASPWGWLSCEETTLANHGWVFACDPSADRVQAPRKIPGYGRFNHEAVAIDPDTLIAYLTEDEGASCLYRFVPTDRRSPFEGRLQALKVVDATAFDTSKSLAVGQVVEVEWVETEADPTATTPKAIAFAKGAASFVRGEGIWWHDGAAYFVSTSGGPVAGGQIFRLVPERRGAKATLELLGQSTDRALLDMPDNITVAPWGTIFLAEDGPSDNFLRILESDGTVTDFARNAKSDSEFAGVCFSPDGRAMFVNIQADGLTLVVTGPFRNGEGTTGGATTGGTSSGPVDPGPIFDCSASPAAPNDGVGAAIAAVGVAAVVAARTL